MLSKSNETKTQKLPAQKIDAALPRVIKFLFISKSRPGTICATWWFCRSPGDKPTDVRLKLKKASFAGMKSHCIVNFLVARAEKYFDNQKYSLHSKLEKKAQLILDSKFSIVVKVCTPLRFPPLIFYISPKCL